jgi:hypothetical protein
MVGIVVGVQVLYLLGKRNWPELFLLALVVSVALLGMRAMGLAQSLPWIPKVPIPAKWGGSQQHGSQQRGAQKKKPRKNRADSHLKVAPQPTNSTSAGNAPSAPVDQGEVDRLLDKIAATGMESLTAQERRQLDEASRRRREGGNR